MGLRRLAAILVMSMFSAGVAAQQVDLDVVLERLDRVARYYRDQALRFTCDETVHYHSHEGRKSYRFSYVYVYDDEGVLRDYRVPRRKGGSSRNKQPPRTEAVDPNALKLPAMLLRAYSWSFVFEAEKRGSYRYALDGEEEVLGRRALKVRFDAVPPFIKGYNEWFGTAWIDSESFLPLRVEALTADQYVRQTAYQRARQDPPAPDQAKRFTIEKFSTEFGIERSGMRFPSETILRQADYRVPGGHGDQGTQRYKVRQLYKNCQFYGVSTEATFQLAAPE